MKIHRFPRLAKDYPEAMTRAMKRHLRLSKGTPRGYDHLTKEQKRVARLVIDGMTVKDACDKVGMDTNTWYRYLHYHKLFKAYYLRYAARTASEVEGRLEAKMGRAVQIVEDALDNPDYYFAHDSAVKLLNGRGLYKKSVDSKNQISGAVAIHGNIKHIGKPMDQELMTAFVQALGGLTAGGKLVEPKVVKGKTISKVINALPEEPTPNASVDSKIQEVDERKAS